MVEDVFFEDETIRYVANMLQHKYAERPKLDLIIEIYLIILNFISGKDIFKSYFSKIQIVTRQHKQKPSDRPTTAMPWELK